MQEKSSSQNLNYSNPFSWIRIQNMDLKDYLADQLDDSHGFISGVLYQLMGLMIILLFNLLFYLAKWYGKGKLKDIGIKGMVYFKYNIYIQFYMLSYLDTCYNGALKLMNVRSIQPKETYLFNILDYDFTIVCAVIVT